MSIKYATIGSAIKVEQVKPEYDPLAVLFAIVLYFLILFGFLFLGFWGVDKWND
jgi:hypothetical protein